MIEKNAMLADGDTVLTAVSGGPDSIALLCFLNDIKEIYNIKLHVFHLNHQIRGLHAEEDERFVSNFAGKLGLSVSLMRFNVPIFAESEKLSLEEAAREVRYKLMEEVAHDVGATKIALGHHADDQVETFLMRLVRGAGIDGLSAMRPVRGIYIRPFLGIRKQKIQDYLAKNRLEYRIDASNEDLSISRNRIRHELVPLLIDNNPQFKDSVLRLIRTVNEDRDFLECITDQTFDSEVDVDATTVSVGIDDMEDMAVAIQRRLIRKMVELVKGDLKGIEFRHIELIVDEAIVGKNRFGIDLPGQVVVFTEYGRLVVAKQDEVASKPIEPQSIRVPGVTNIDELGIAISASFADPNDVVFENNGRIAHLNADKIVGNVVVRSREPGDVFSPFGMNGEKKLQDFFVDLKIARRTRDRIPIVVLGNDILWVAGYRINDRYRVTAETRQVLVLRVEEL